MLPQRYYRLQLRLWATTSLVALLALSGCTSLPRNCPAPADVQPEQLHGAWTVQLDGRPVKTPAKTPLVLPTRTLAEAIAAEWDAQQGVVRPDTMPATRAANSALDKVATQFAEVADMIAAYFEATVLAGFAEAEARKFFGQPKGFTRDTILIEPLPAYQAQAKFLERFEAIDVTADQDLAHGQALLAHYPAFYQGDAVHTTPHFADA